MGELRPGERQQQDIGISTKFPEKVTLYHGTLYRNIPSILTSGIIPRAKPVETILQELCERYAFPVSKIRQGLLDALRERQAESAGKVFLTTYRDYAISQSISSLEVEAILTEEILEKKGTPLPDWGYEKWLQLYRDIQVAVCAIYVPTNKLDDLARLKYHWEGYKKRGTTRDKAIKFTFDVVTINAIPQGWIISCEKVPITIEKIAELLEEYAAFE